MSEHLQYRGRALDKGRLNDSLKFFFSEYDKIPVHERKVLELGTRRWGTSPTHHKAELAPWMAYLMADAMPGEDVDLVADAHALSLPDESLSVVWASSVWEHLHSPWKAATEVLRVLRPGGLFFVQTHLAFPEHGYPNDFFRFTRQGLERLFDVASRKVSCYEYPADLTPQSKEIEWNKAAPNYLNVCIAGRK